MAKKENQNIEFKENWNDNILKTICAFANAEGGVVYIGVDDKGKSVEIKNTKKLLEDIPNKIRDMIGIVAEVKLRKLYKKSVIWIRVDKYKAPISYKGKFYMRSGSTTSDLRGHSLSRFLLLSSGTTWESVVEPGSSIKDVKVKTIRYFQDLAKKQYPFIAKEKDVKAVLQKLGLMEGDNLKRAAILLFGKDTKRYFTSAFIQVGRFISDSEVISTDRIEGNLFEQLENTIQILRIKYLENRFYYEGIYRKEDMIYPEEALREAVINSLIHRDYIGPQIQMKIYPDTLHLWNVGELSKKITFAQLKRKHPSYKRNELLADVFFKAGLIESWGRGTLKIINECKAKNIPDPKFVGEFGGFSVTFTKGKIFEQVQESGSEATQEGSEKSAEKVRRKYGENAEKVFEIITRDSFVKTRDIAAEVKVSQNAVEKIIRKLKKEGVLKRIGPDKGGRWEIIEE